MPDPPQSTAQSAPQPPSTADAPNTKPDSVKDKGKAVPGREQEPRASTTDPPPMSNGGPSHRPSGSSDVATAASNETDRSRRRRSGLDFRNSPRISELFSGFRHRRLENDSEPTPRPPTPPRSSREHIITPVINPPKPEPPPPKLPPPSLNDLGLSMSVLTGSLNPAHFASPPTSGTFLAPHYLLLCHAQGLDVLSLISPPAPEPFAIVRRVNFKSVVVMEERGVMIAIAGRRDVVRVYALDELRRVIEWRLDMETRKEKERLRKEEGKKLSGKVDHVFGVTLPPKDLKDPEPKSLPSPSLFADSKPSILQPRAPTSGRPRRRLKQPPPIQPSVPSDPPPAYTSTNGVARTPSQSPQAQSHSSGKRPAAVDARKRSASISTLSPAMHNSTLPQQEDDDEVAREGELKTDWMERDASSDDEAITIAAAGASGSAALDERTSSRPPDPSMDGLSVTVSHSPPTLRDLHSQSVAVISPTLERANYFRESFPRATTGDALTIRPSNRSSIVQGQPTLSAPAEAETTTNEPEPTVSGDHGTNETNDDDDEAVTPVGEVSLAMMLMESRIPDLPPPGSWIQQQAIFLGSPSPAAITEEPDTFPIISPPPTPVSSRSRRRWSVLGPSSTDSLRDRARESSNNETRQVSRNRPRTAANQDLSRSNSSRMLRTSPSNPRIGSRHIHSASNPDMNPPLSAPPSSDRRHVSGSQSSGSFFPKFISAVLGQRPSTDGSRKAKLEKDPLQIGPATVPQPKLDYVKLPGTKGSILVKAVETSKKSFLAILCGDAGEKVELFAGTYRTALSLSRTFILPDSPRSLELQVQGDDLVEIFLVFSQNVFGLEPATVRVREVRIGRAERRAARRRARENITTSGQDTPVQVEEDTNVSVSIGVVASETNESAGADFPDPDGLNNTGDEPDPQPMQATPTTAPDPEELLAIASAQSIPYSTFQQLSFAPAFPLAILGEDVIIPPSYPSFLRHRTKYESNNETVPEVPVQQFTPPGLPPPKPVQQSKWYYRDPKGVIQGPWKSSLMHSWYKDGLLPLDLPVRRDSDSQFCLLKDLRAQSVDPEHPFRNYANQVVASTSEAIVPMEAQPLLPPVSLLEQPRHFGPPALFFSSRGGHSTTIVDAKGRSVLKGRFLWSPDEANDEGPILQVKLGDVQRLEAFDVRNRAIIVALRQGGLEAVDVGDALYRPADESRSYIPSFQAPLSGFNRRAPYVWRIGGPLTLPASASPVGSRDALGMSIKKNSNAGSISMRSPSRNDHRAAHEEFEATGQEEVIYLGRKEDDLYLCEKTALSFRILRLSPS